MFFIIFAGNAICLTEKRRPVKELLGNGISCTIINLVNYTFLVHILNFAFGKYSGTPLSQILKGIEK